ncbi:MAG: hypothetical protein NTZ38_03605 [Candidatus Taylorbacteria bacterium]|nr:hypothetical protein [Candidatus Taylorbacteria bacterium]
MTGLLTQRFFENVIRNSPLFAEEMDDILKTGKLPEDSRQEEQESLNKLIDDIIDNNPDTGMSRDEIVEMFIDAKINGNLLGIGRLIEKSLGKGSFRATGEKSMWKDKE